VPVTPWLHCADHQLAPVCRSVTIGNAGLVGDRQHSLSLLIGEGMGQSGAHGIHSSIPLQEAALPFPALKVTHRNACHLAGRNQTRTGLFEQSQCSRAPNLVNDK